VRPARIDAREVAQLMLLILDLSTSKEPQNL